MKPKPKDLFTPALAMSPVERVVLVAGLDKPDETVDLMWRKEIAARLRAYRSGKADTVPADDVLAEYGPI